MGAGVPGRKERAAVGPVNQESYWSLFSYPKRVYLPVQEPVEGVGCELLSHDQEAVAGVDPASGVACSRGCAVSPGDGVWVEVVPLLGRPQMISGDRSGEGDGAEGLSHDIGAAALLHVLESS